MIETKKGDLLKLSREGYFNAIAHGCNCFVSMGAGIAKQIAKQYPKAEAVDRLTAKGDIHKLGDFTIADIKGFKIFNLYTQYTPGPDFKYFALSNCLWKMDKFFNPELSIVRSKIKIGLPMIGAGIGGGDWNIIKGIIETYLSYHDVTIVEYNPFAR